ncbi:MAG: SulP family inorganic anion transporter [bacterium]
MLLNRFFPFLNWAGSVNRDTIRSDLVAGLTGAVIVLPQAIAFSAIAGLPPEYGLYTAMVTPIVAALFGSSWHLVSGPTTAISIVIFATVSRHAAPGSEAFIQYALTLTFVAGCYQLLFGLLRLGQIINFVSHNVVVGFTTGAAILIGASQIQHVLGIDIGHADNLFEKFKLIYEHASSTNVYALAIAAVTLATSIIVKSINSKLPHLLIAMVVGSLTCIALNGTAHGVEMVPSIPSHLPPVSIPHFSFDIMSDLAPEALAIALLGLIEAVSIARAVAAQSQQKINGDQEFIGQGLSNIVGSFFSSYAGSGSFTRSGVNYEAGAKTPMSAIFAAFILMAIVLLAAPLATYLPVPAMGAVILVVAYNLVHPDYIRKVFKISRRETSVLVVTFLATLFLDLEFAIYAGVLLSLSLFLMRTSTPEMVSMAPDHASPKHRLSDIKGTNLVECPQLKIIRVDMSVYFGSITYIQRRLGDFTDKEGYKHILILGPSINFIDMAGAEMLVAEAKRLRQLGGGLYICGIKPSVCDYLKRTGFAEEFGMDNLFFKKNEAIIEIGKRLDRNQCAKCQARIFIECAEWAAEGRQLEQADSGAQESIPAGH